MSHANNNFTEDDVILGCSIYKQYNERFNREPVFENARAILDKAKSKAPEEASQQPPSVIQRNREAFAELKASLASVRSNKTNSIFNETLPTTRGESTARAQICVDSVNDNLSTTNPPTSITANVRPHNMESFKMAREIFLRGTSDAIEDVSQVSAAIKVRAKLSPNASPEAFKKAMETAEALMDPSLAEEFKYHLNTDDNGYVTFTGGTYLTRFDPLHKLFKIFERNEDAFSSSNFRHAAGAPDMVRLATLRIDIAHDLGKWLMDNKGKKESSWTSLLEGLRIACEVITRDNSGEHIKADVAEQILSSDGQRSSILAALALVAGLECVKENTIDLQLAPLELLYALGVEDAALALRKTLSAKVAADYKPEKKTKNDELEEYLSSNACENDVASTISSFLKFGATNMRIEWWVKYMIGFLLVGKGPEEFRILDTLLPVPSCIEEITSVSILSPSGVVDFDIKGINSKLWNWLPTTCQGGLDLAKPYFIAALEDAGKIKPDGEGFDFATRTLDDPGKQVDELFMTLSEDQVEDEIYEKTFIRRIERFIRRCFVPTLERPKKKNCSTENPDARPAAAWDLPSVPAEFLSTAACAKYGKENKSILKLINNFADPEAWILTMYKIEHNESLAARSTNGNKTFRGRGRPPRGRRGGDSDDEEENDDESNNNATPPSDLFDDEFTQAEAQRAFEMFDEDGSGYLERTEAMSAFLTFYPHASPSDILAKIRAADVNGDGKLSFIEFAKIQKTVKMDNIADDEDEDEDY